MTDWRHHIFSLIESGDLAAVSSTVKKHPHLLQVQGDYGNVYPSNLGQRLEEGPPLHAAAWHDQVEMVQFLVGIGASLHEQDGIGDTALHVAAIKGSTGAAKALLDLGAPLDDHNSVGWTPLHRAAAWGSTDILKLLIERGARVSAQDDAGDTPLYWARWARSVNCVEELLRAGAVDQVGHHTLIFYRPPPFVCGLSVHNFPF